MEMNFDSINWWAVIVCIVVGQIFLTVWFVAIFGESWARAYGVSDKKQHAKEIPGYTYAIGIVCMAFLTVGIAVLQISLSVNTLSGGFMFGLWMAIHFSIATALPGYAFLKRWKAFFLAIGSQTILIIIISITNTLWQKS